MKIMQRISESSRWPRPAWVVTFMREILWLSVYLNVRSFNCYDYR